MSKCREAYEKIIGEPWGYDLTKTQIWQAAWNARGKVDAEICQQVTDNSNYTPTQQYASAACRNAIEQEQFK